MEVQRWRRGRTVAQIVVGIASLPPRDIDAVLGYIRELHHNDPDGTDGTGPQDDPEPAEPAQADDGARPDAEVRMFGTFEVALGGVPVRAWGGARIRTVFQYLLLHDRPVRRDVLMDLLWPGHTYRSARNNLNVCFYGLRGALEAAGGRDHMVYRDGCYSLNDDLTWSVDTRRYTAAADRMRDAIARRETASALCHAQAAVDEYGGPLLDGEPRSDWCDQDRSAFAERFVQILQRIGELKVGIGDVPGAELAAQRLLRLDTCRESAHRLLMVCYARQSQLDLVARQFRRCTTQLRAELDIDPSAETVRLYRELVAR